MKKSNLFAYLTKFINIKFISLNFIDINFINFKKYLSEKK